MTYRQAVPNTLKAMVRPHRSKFNHLLRLVGSKFALAKLPRFDFAHFNRQDAILSDLECDFSKIRS
jgi:hypothetical protein